MASSYPTSLDSLSTSHADGVGEIVHAATVNDLADAVNKIEAAVGASPANDYATLSARVAAHANAQARAHGFICWTFDPIFASSAGTQANTHLVGVYLGKGTPITTIVCPVTSAGAGMTFAELGIYDGSLNLVANTANSPTAFQSTGWIAVNLTSPYTIPSSGLYYLASGFTGTTLPSVAYVLASASGSTILSTGYPGTTKPRGIHAQVPSGALPNPAVSQGTFSNMALLAAY